MEADNVGNKRQRFYVELKPDQTTIVSWKRLLKNSSIRPDPVPDPDPAPSLFPPPLGHVTDVQEKTSQVDESTTHYESFHYHEGLEYMNAPVFSSNNQSKSIKKRKTKKGYDLIDNKDTKPDLARMNATFESTKASEKSWNIKPSGSNRRASRVHHLKDIVEDMKDADENSVRHQKHRRRNTSNKVQLDLHSKKLTSNTINGDFSLKVSHMYKNGRHELPDLNLPHCPTQPVVSAERK